jgi:hypothetical protein
MTEEEWLAATHPTTMLEFLRGEAASDRKWRLFACMCLKESARYKSRGRYEPRLEPELRRIDLTEQFVDGKVTPTEWEAVRVGRHISLHAHSHAFSSAGAAVLDAGRHNWHLGNDTDEVQQAIQEKRQSDFLRDIFGNPFRPVTLDPAWLTSTVVTLAQQMYD